MEEEESTSLLQLHDTVSRQGSTSKEQARPSSSGLPDMVADLVHQALEKEKAAYQNAEFQDKMINAGNPFLPSAVDHGKVAQNPHVLDAQAETNEIPGLPGGDVVQAYDVSMNNAEDKMMEYTHPNAKDIKEALDYDKSLVKKTRQAKDAIVDSLQKDQVGIEAALAERRKAEQASLDSVEMARKGWEEQRIKELQADSAALAGRHIGEVVGEERAAFQLDNELRRAEMDHLQQEHHELTKAMAQAKADGFTAADRYKRMQRAAGEDYLSALKQQSEAIRADAKRNAHLVEGSIIGAEGIKDHMIKQAAQQATKQYNQLSKDARKDIRETVAHGAYFAA